MNTYAALVIITGYVASVRRTVRERTGPNRTLGSITLEQAVVTVGLIGVALVLIVAVTAAVQRRVDQIN